MSERYPITIAGLRRSLPICAVDHTLDIAAFIIFGDVELTVKASEALLEKAPEFDIILTPEAKSIPIAYEMARQSGKPYIVARKGQKVYMPEPVFTEVKSITTGHVQRLYLGKNDRDMMTGKRVLIVDDVISTGDSLRAAQALCEMAGGVLAGKCAILAEGHAADRPDIFFLGKLPLFFK
ncbi:MAG: adenine phosphoribosyltransferase [Oscillospiraceae bacterium]|jgi:adenine phosphoribosyltransferase|nr:adenine phosphoribosyltransferase [Oscillospiraceae bacterium]